MTPKHQIDYTYFLTAATHDRFPFFGRKEIAQIAMETLRGYDPERFTLHAVVIMRDHIHVLFTPAEDQLLERCLQCIKGGTSHATREYRKGATLWQTVNHTRRVRDAEEFAGYVKYIRENPEKAGLRDWPFLYIAEPHGAKAPYDAAT